MSSIGPAMLCSTTIYTFPQNGQERQLVVELIFMSSLFGGPSNVLGREIDLKSTLRGFGQEVGITSGSSLEKSKSISYWIFGSLGPGKLEVWYYLSSPSRYR